MAANPVALILGAGPRVGASVAERFASKGYQVVITSRKGTGSRTSEGYFSVKADFTQPDSIPGVFDAVRAELHTSPSVVVYNAAALTPPADQASPFSISASSMMADLNVNTISPYVAAQQAFLGFETLPKETKKTFIYTGNIQNLIVVPMVMMMTLGVGKSASAYWIGQVDGACSVKGYRFFYADERTEDGNIKGMKLDGPAHGDFYVQLASHEGLVPWHATFVKGKGHVAFE